MTSSYTSPTTKPIYRGIQAIWYILGIIEILLTFRFFLKLFGANPSAPFTQFVYDISRIFAQPFLSVFRNDSVTSGSIFEWTTLLAMAVYWIVAAGIIELLLMGRSVSTPEAANRLENTEDQV